jgi:glucose-6-phosphate isomerase
MITLLSLALMQTPNYAKMNTYAQKPIPVCTKEYNVQKTPLLAYQAYTLPRKVSFSGYNQEFKMPQANPTQFKTFDEVFTNYEPSMKNVMNDFDSRKDKDGQFLKWVSLPANQLAKGANGKSHLDDIYSQASNLAQRKNADGTSRPLVVLGIGGSKHTAEFLLNMNGLGNKGKVYFYSDIDPVSFNNFLKETGKDVKDLNFLVVSKSGTTFETQDAFKRFENSLEQEYKKSGMSENDAKVKAQEHFAICTDKTANDKNLRGKIGAKNGEGNKYIKELYIHDDVGGRFSMFDDAGLFTIAYAGVKETDAERILKSAAATSEKLTNPKTLKDNSAAKSAIFNVFSRENGYKIEEQQYYGKLFEGGGENWAKQLYLESLKDFDFSIGKAPDSMHYATEGQFNPNNRKKYNTVMTIMNPNISANYKTYTNAISKTYNETTPLKMEILDVEGDKIKPEAIGEYIQTKHFETVYEGMLRREVSATKNGSSQNSNKTKCDKLPEVLQPSVETYKNKFKMGEYKLNPGS